MLPGVGINPQIRDFGHLLGGKKFGWGHVPNGDFGKFGQTQEIWGFGIIEEGFSAKNF